MKITKRSVWWLVFNAIILIMAYYGLYEEKIEYINAVKFFIWFDFVIWMVLMFVPDDEKNKLKKIGLPISNEINLTYTLIFGGLLASKGLYFYAGMTAFVVCIQMNIWETEDEGS